MKYNNDVALVSMNIKFTVIATGLCAVLFSNSAFAVRLEVPSGANFFYHFTAVLLLYAHISGGAIGILSGMVATMTKKGSKNHRLAGKTFFWSMLICYLIGGLVAPFLDTQQSTNFVAAILALYLLLSGTSTASRRCFVAGRGEKVGLIVAALITLLGATFMILTLRHPDGSFDGSPPQAYVLFIVAGSLALVGEIKVLYQKKLNQTARVFRHLWRMCMSFFIASGSAFFGQAAFFPEWFNATYLPLALGFFPLVIMVIYTIKYLYAFLKKTYVKSTEEVSSMRG
ncbi:hypothetical protein [Alteromonas stellipolaris]|uniref:hypothetical protein n=1 Tax=Alteromonas stellipolaris TaxID=233316 RepID=UPI001D5FAB7F|nr:hypothetical protein [Alteromonas stellipolaris]MBZ2163336.1 hypothetical protein [Alteromonas stellipolaris]